ncbi:MAG: Magnesium and cobalt efflux protein CorC [Verrucomicrobia subdivision 3 bacterium]|nr:Magnesium and cobalt efflux protein CorC [Limisphaerales bacterium]MCS1416456.1 Magnesium and cobalt efflux protein CorC [Limisphaerales bacterium]
MPVALRSTLTAILLIATASTLSFAFALAESALFSLSPWQTKKLAENDPKLRGLLQGLRDRPQDFLATIVLGNTIANTLILGIALHMVFRAEWGAWVTLPVIGFVLLIGCEIVPKTLALRLPEKWTQALLRPTALTQNILRPIHLLAQRTNEKILQAIIPSSVRSRSQTTDEDYQELVEMGAQSGTLDEDEKEIILEIISLDSKSVGDVMTPRSQIAKIPYGLEPEEMLAAANRYQHTQLLLEKPPQDDDQSQDEIIGVLDARRLILNPNTDIDELMDVPSFVPETMNLRELFIGFQKQPQKLAVVLDEYGQTAGIITLEDILEEIMGPIFQDERAAPPDIERLGPGRWRASGLAPIEDFAKEYAAIGEVEEVDTMGGLMATLLAHIPNEPASAEFRGLRLTARVSDQTRIRDLLVEQIAPDQR